MPSPTQQQWRIQSQPAPFLPANTTRERQLACLATYVTGINPDGSNLSGIPTNLLTAEQSSFEGGTTGGWIPAGCTVANSTAQAQSGTHSLALTSTVNSDCYCVLTIPVNPSFLYTCSGYARAATTSRSCLIIVFSGGGSASITDSSSTWTFGQSPPTLPPSSSITLACYVVSAVIGEVHYFDNLFFGIV